MWRLLIKKLTDYSTLNKLLAPKRTIITTSRSIQSLNSKQTYINDDEKSKNVANTASSQTLNQQNGGAGGYQNKASLEQLILLEEELVKWMPEFFNTGHPWQLYTKDLLFIDNTRNVKCKGYTLYSFHINLIKVYYYMNYSSSRFTLLNLVKNPEESSIKIRWRIISRPGFLRAALLFWRCTEEIWRDGLSTLHVDQEGKIFCHICDNIDVDSQEVPSTKQTLKDRLVNRGLV